MKVNKKLLQRHLSETTGKVVTLKDISNVQTSITTPDDSVEAVVDALRKIEGKQSISHEMNSLKFIFYAHRLHC